MKITSEADALKVMQCLHDKGPKTVVLSSTNLGSEGILVALASTVKGQWSVSGGHQLPVYIHGTCIEMYSLLGCVSPNICS